MLNGFNELSTKEKLLIVGGLGLVVLMFMRAITGKNTTTNTAVNDNTAAAVEQSISGLARQIESISSQTAQSMSDQNAAIIATFQDYQEVTEDRIDSVQTALTESVKALKDSQTQTLSSVSELISKMATPVNTTTSAPQTSYYPQPANNVPDKPTITVRAGSVEEKYLRDSYGSAVNIVTTTANQFVGETRNETYAMYQQELASKGVQPNNQLTQADLAKYK